MTNVERLVARLADLEEKKRRAREKKVALLARSEGLNKEDIAALAGGSDNSAIASQLAAVKLEIPECDAEIKKIGAAADIVNAQLVEACQAAELERRRAAIAAGEKGIETAIKQFAPVMPTVTKIAEAVIEAGWSGGFLDLSPFTKALDAIPRPLYNLINDQTGVICGEIIAGTRPQPSIIKSPVVAEVKQPPDPAAVLRSMRIELDNSRHWRQDSCAGVENLRVKIRNAKDSDEKSNFQFLLDRESKSLASTDERIANLQTEIAKMEAEK